MQSNSAGAARLTGGWCCWQMPNRQGPPSVFSSEGSTRLNSGESSIGNQDTQQLYASMFEQLMPDQGNLVSAIPSLTRPPHLSAWRHC